MFEGKFEILRILWFWCIYLFWSSLGSISWFFI